MGSRTGSLGSKVGVGQRFGRLVVEALARPGRYLRATCRCECEGPDPRRK